MAVRSVRIRASGTVCPAEGEPSKRLYETLASPSSTDAAVVAGFFRAQSARWAQATRPRTTAIVRKETVRLTLFLTQTHPSTQSIAVAILILALSSILQPEHAHRLSDARNKSGSRYVTASDEYGHDGED